MQIAAQPGLTERFARQLEALLAPQHFTQSTRAPHLAVAVSGGADSMALALLAHAWAVGRKGRITALTVDHQLRPESRREAEQVAAWLAQHGIIQHILTPPHRGVPNNLQEAARIWRYDALAEYCQAQGILHCLIAHHAGDQRETIGLHQARGETMDGPAGMAALRNYRGVRFLRPLLATEKTDLVDYLCARKQDWIEDPSNQNENFARVRLRQELEDDAPQRTAHARTASVQGATRHARDVALARAAMQGVLLFPQGHATLQVEAWNHLPVLQRSQLLADLLTTIGGATHRPRKPETERLMRALRDDGKHTLHGCEITRSGDTIAFARETARVAAPLLLSGHGNAVWDGRFHVRHALPHGVSITLQALGASGRKQLGESTLPLATPSLWHLDELLGVPHIPSRSAHWPEGAVVTVGFAPPKPLAAAPFWWLNQET